MHFSTGREWWGLGIYRRLRAPLFSASHRCSIGDKSGLYGSRSSGILLWLARKLLQTLATWGRALSCCKINWRCCTRRIATWQRTSSLYLTAIKLPTTTIKCDFTPSEMPSQSTEETPQNLNNASVGEAYQTRSTVYRLGVNEWNETQQ